MGPKPKKGGGSGSKGDKAKGGLEPELMPDEERAQMAGLLSAASEEFLKSMRALEECERDLREASQNAKKRHSDLTDIGLYFERQRLEKDARAQQLEGSIESMRAGHEREMSTLSATMAAQEERSQSLVADHLRQVEASSHALAFLPDYEEKLASNKQLDEAIRRKREELTTLQQEIAVKREQMSCVQDAKSKSDKAGPGSIAVVTLRVMSCFPESAVIQHHGLAAISGLLVHTDGAQADIVHRHGGVNVVVDAIVRHGQASIHVATHAVNALWMLTAGSPALWEDVNDHDILPAIVSILRTHGGNPRLAVNACGAMCHALVLRPQRLSIASQIESLPQISTGASHVLSREVVAALPDEEELWRQIQRSNHLKPAKRKSMGGAAERGRVSLLGGPTKEPGPRPPRRDRARRSHPILAWQREVLSAAVANMTREVRSNLPQSPPSLDMIPGAVAMSEDVARGALEALVEVMRTQAPRPRAVEYSLFAIWNLALSLAAIAQAFVEEHDGVHLVLAAMQSHGSDAGVLLYGVANLLAVIDVHGARKAMVDLRASALMMVRTSAKARACWTWTLMCPGPLRSPGGDAEASAQHPASERRSPAAERPGAYGSWWRGSAAVPELGFGDPVGVAWARPAPAERL